MSGRKKQKDKKDIDVEKILQENRNSGNGDCPVKDGDNCLVPGGFNDSEPIGGG